MSRFRRWIGLAVLAALIGAGSPTYVQPVAPDWEPDMARARAAAAEVLARDEFRQDASATALARLRERITNWIVRTWQRFGGNRIDGRRAATVMAWTLGGIALLSLSWWLVASLLRATDRSGLSLTAPASRRRSARAWAQQAAGATEPREAIRCAYRAALAGFEEEGAWRADDARTPREHVRLLAPGHQRRPLFAAVARRFEEVWFGARPATADDSREMLSYLRELGWLRPD